MGHTNSKATHNLAQSRTSTLECISNPTLANFGTCKLIKFGKANLTCRQMCVKYGCENNTMTNEVGVLH